MQAGKRTTFVKTMARLTAHAGKRQVVTSGGQLMPEKDKSFR
jgi:hypothetical protein